MENRYTGGSVNMSMEYGSGQWADGSGGIFTRLGRLVMFNG
jgi:hypothetical protein